MAMFTKNQPKVINEQTVPTRTPEAYKGAEVDTTYQDRRKLITYVEGQSWIVTFYKQILGDDDESNALSVNTPEAFQQYQKIENFELKVTSALSGSFEAGPNEWDISGTSNIFPSIIPNRNDVFVSDIGDGRLGIFCIDNVNEKSYFKDTVYEIEYHLMGEYASERKEKLDRGVVQSMVFDKDRLLYGLTGLVTEEKVMEISELREWERTLFMTLFQNYIDDEEITWRVPSMQGNLYDYFYANMMSNLFETRDVMNAVRLLNIGAPSHMKHTSVWDALLQRDRALLAVCESKLRIVGRKEVFAPAVLNSAFYSRFDRFVLPPKLIKTILAKGLVNDERVGFPLQVFVESKDMILTDDSQPFIYPVGKDGHYLFSEAFYTRQGRQSILEEMVNAYLDKRPVSLHKLKKILAETPHWNNLAKFYYFPVLIILIRAAIYQE